MELHQKILSELREVTYTRADLYYRIELLKEFFESTFFHEQREKKPLEELLKGYLEEKNENEKTIHALTALKDDVIQEIEMKSLYKIISLCKQDVEKLRTIVLYAPVIFSSDWQEKLGKWVRENVDPSILLVLEVDQTVSGGCAFVLDNVYHDFSFRHFFRLKEDELESMFQSRYKAYANERTVK